MKLNYLFIYLFIHLLISKVKEDPSPLLHYMMSVIKKTIEN
uniref:Uncharacterized protein n=1 Tax=Rhizophora mucronata TaxID=61149 RepID=A0A2P2PLJ5_RHIMU